MVSTMDDVKSKILEIFLRIREERNAPYEEVNFIEFLVKPSRWSINDSFKGLRYKNRFIDEIEMEFCVCFPNNFFDKKWNLADLAAYVSERMQKPDVNRRMALKKVQDAKQDPTTENQFIVLNLFLVPPAFGLLALAQHGWEYLTIPILYLAVPGAANFLLYRSMARYVSYQKMLIAKISAQRGAGSA
jgi:hypothetical protein